MSQFSIQIESCTVVENHQKFMPKMGEIFLFIFVTKIKTLFCAQFWKMRLFEWFWNIVKLCSIYVNVSWERKKEAAAMRIAFIESSSFPSSKQSLHLFWPLPTCHLDFLKEFKKKEVCQWQKKEHWRNAAVASVVLMHLNAKKIDANLRFLNTVKWNLHLRRTTEFLVKK